MLREYYPDKPRKIPNPASSHTPAEFLQSDANSRSMLGGCLRADVMEIHMPPAHV